MLDRKLDEYELEVFHLRDLIARLALPSHGLSGDDLDEIKSYVDDYASIKPSNVISLQDYLE